MTTTQRVQVRYTDSEGNEHVSAPMHEENAQHLVSKCHELGRKAEVVQ